MPETHRGSCYCGAVTLEATGTPAEMGYCHCPNCRRYSGAPVNAFTLWKKEDVKVTSGTDSLHPYRASDFSERVTCEKCGGNVMVNHPSIGMVDIPAGILPALQFQPAVHLNYEDTVLPMKDGLPKQKDFPAAIGGSGELMPE